MSLTVKPAARAVGRNSGLPVGGGERSAAGALDTLEKATVRGAGVEILDGCEFDPGSFEGAEQAIWRLTGRPGNLAFTRRGVEQLGSSLGS